MRKCITPIRNYTRLPLIFSLPNAYVFGNIE